MAYATSNPPHCLVNTPNFRLWVYKSTDNAAAVRASGYITNGYDLGMRAGDIVMMVDTDASPIAAQMMIVTSAVSGTVDLSDGTAIVATDSD